MTTARKVFITGASSGIGAALARLYARPGAVLGLLARRAELLEALAGELRAQGATVWVAPADVTDAEAMDKAATGYLDRFGTPDRVIANAGIGGTQSLGEVSAREVSRVFAVNVQGVIHTLIPFVAPMIRAGSGTLVAMSSMAGTRVIPGATAYSVSKVAVTQFVDGLRMELAGTGVHAMSLCPGFIRTAMTSQLLPPLPFLMELESAAQIMVEAIERERSTFVFPWQMRWLRLPMRLVPEGLYRRLVTRG